MDKKKKNNNSSLNSSGQSFQLGTLCIISQPSFDTQGTGRYTCPGVGKTQS